MKKFFFIAVTLIAFQSAIAQTTQGSMMLGGGLSFYSDTEQANDDYENKGLTFSPNFGYFVSDNLAVGLSLSISNSTFDTGASSTDRNSFGIGPFVRYYKFTSSEQFAFFGQADLMFVFGKEDDTPGGETNNRAISFGVSPGFAYFFNEHWAFDIWFLGIRYESYDDNTDVDDNSSNSFRFGVQSLSPNIGVRYHFGGN